MESLGARIVVDRTNPIDPTPRRILGDSGPDLRVCRRGYRRGDRWRGRLDSVGNQRSVALQCSGSGNSRTTRILGAATDRDDRSRARLYHVERE